MSGIPARSARQWALKALARRMHTVHEIRTGLSDRGYPPDTVDAVVGELRERGYLDDRQFVRMWISSRAARRLQGRLRIMSDLHRKGVDGEVARAVIEEELTADGELDIARKAARKRARTLRTYGTSGRAALYRHLRSKGFDSHIIRTVLADLNIEEEQT